MLRNEGRKEGRIRREGPTKGRPAPPFLKCKEGGEGRKEVKGGNKEGRKEERKKGWKGGRKEQKEDLRRPS